MGFVLTSVIALAPQLGAPIGVEATEGALTASPTLRAYLDGMNIDYHDLYVTGPTVARASLLSLGNTGFLGGIPIQKMPRRKSPKYLREVTDLDTLRSMFEKYASAGKVFEVLAIIDQIGRVGGFRGAAFLKNIADHYLERFTLRKSLAGSHFGAAYAMSQIGLHALEHLTKTKSPFALEMAREFLTGKKGVVAFSYPNFRNEAILLEPTHSVVVREILKVLQRGEFGLNGAMLLKDLLIRMDYVLKTEVIQEGCFREDGTLMLDPFQIGVDVTVAVFETVVQYKEGGLFLRLLEKNPTNVSIAFSRQGVELLEFVPDEEGDPLDLVRDGVKRDPKTFAHYLNCIKKYNRSPLRGAVLEGLKKALEGPNYLGAASALVEISGDDAARVLIYGYRLFVSIAIKQLQMVEALSRMKNDVAAQFFEEETERTSRLFFRRRKRLRNLAEETRTRRRNG